jgi:3-hydroxybutyryl-CoA dehydrogenase
MQAIVVADDAGREEFMEKKLSSDIQVSFAENLTGITNYDSADAIFILQKEIEITNPDLFGGKPVFINSTIKTLKDLDLQDNFIRINAWPTFIKREVWEMATRNEDLVKDIFEKLGWKYITVDDEPGLVSARIISMIINEAYFALGEDVSSKEEIDLAMKLGTNYPYGPFEWSRKIGLNKIYSLLKKLSETDSRYSIAQELENEISNS